MTQPYEIGVISETTLVRVRCAHCGIQVDSINKDIPFGDSGVLLMHLRQFHPELLQPDSVLNCFSTNGTPVTFSTNGNGLVHYSVR